MNLQEFDELYKNKLSHDKIEIKCDNCKTPRTPLKTRAKQTIQKNSCYLCPSCGQKNKHLKNPMREETKLKIAEGVKRYYYKK